MTKETIISDIERINVAILILGSILSILITKDFKCLFSFAVASSIMVLNFRLLKKILEGGFILLTMKKKALLLVLPFKFLALAGAVVIILKYGNIDVVFFLMGLTTLFLSIIVARTYSLVSPMLKRRQKNGA